MAERYDLPGIPATAKPSFWNHDTAKWALLGELSGLVAGAIVVAGLTLIGLAPVAGLVLIAAPVVSLAGMALGAQHGAQIGMARQARELAEGKVAKDPTYWNKGIVSGYVVGKVAGLGLSLITGVPALGLLGLLGAATGSVLREQALEKDMQQAVAIRNSSVQQVTVPSQGISPYKDSVSLEEMQALDAKQAATPNASHAQAALDSTLQQNQSQR